MRADPDPDRPEPPYADPAGAVHPPDRPDDHGHAHDRDHDVPQRRPDPEYSWLDDEAGPVVRPYTMTGGRGRPAAGGFDLVAFVVAARGVDAAPVHLQPEHRAILAATREPLSVAEVSAHLNLAVGVVRVLLGDLLQLGLISMFEPSAARSPLDERVLKAVINGLQAL